MFALLALALVAGIVAGALSGGSFSSLRHVHFRGSPLLFAALVVGLIPLFVTVDPWLRTTILISTLLGVLIWLVLNLSRARGGLRAALAVIALGWGLNFIVISANGAMPLSARAYEQSGQTGAITGGRGGFFKVEPETESTILPPLGDVIPVRAIRQVLSIGDVFLIIGIAAAIAAGMHAREPQEVAAAAEARRREAN